MMRYVTAAALVGASLILAVPASANAVKSAGGAGTTDYGWKISFSATDSESGDSGVFNAVDPDGNRYRGDVVCVAVSPDEVELSVDVIAGPADAIFFSSFDTGTGSGSYGGRDFVGLLLNPSTTDCTASGRVLVQSLVTGDIQVRS